MYKVERAIIIGCGKRNPEMRPVNAAYTKAIGKVNGKRMIDSVIEALHKNGISENLYCSWISERSI